MRIRCPTGFVTVIVGATLMDGYARRNTMTRERILGLSNYYTTRFVKSYRKTAASKYSFGNLGGARGNRTPDLLHAMQALSHLSYGPGATP